jgi:hypothetical protein
MAAKPRSKTFRALLASRKGKNTQVVLPSIGIVSAKISLAGEDIVQLETKVGGKAHVFFIHYSAVVIAT